MKHSISYTKTKLNVPSAQTVARKNNACVKVIPHFINMGVALGRFMILRLNDAPSIVERLSIDVMLLYMSSLLRSMCVFFYSSEEKIIDEVFAMIAGICPNL